MRDHIRKWAVSLFPLIVVAGIWIASLLTLKAFDWQHVGRFFLFSCAYLAVLEVGFRVGWFLVMRRRYVLKSRPDLSRYPCVPHPYLTFTYPTNAFIPEVKNAKFLLNPQNEYVAYGVKTNSWRIADGPSGDREIVLPKPEGLVRIACLGESTTASYLRYEGVNYSYPLALEHVLRQRFSAEAIEVNNFGQGGWNSADILVSFLLHGFDAKPDVAVLYFGFNDIQLSLSKSCRPDYSDVRRNLAYAYRDLERLAVAPRLPSAAYNYWLSCCFDGLMDKYENQQALTDIGVADFDNSLDGLRIFRRNLDHLVKICRANDIDVVLCTYAHYQNRFNAKMKRVQKFREALGVENDMIRDIAAANGVAVADIDRVFPREEKYYIDSMHFSHLGIELLGDIVAKPVGDFVAARLNARKRLA